ENTPSAGLRWSKNHYPAQYEPGKAREVKLKASGSGGGFLSFQRYMDVGGAAYSRNFISDFSYAGKGKNAPEVRVEYLPGAETFTGRIVARNLKPNFAYQLKLVGKTEDMMSFENIGFLGRWRAPLWGTNFDDEQYRKFPDKKSMRSYLFFDFLVTDGRGEAEREFYADSTLHVLFNANWQKKPRREDSRPRTVAREVPDPMIYANPNVELAPQQVYAQSESDANNSERPRIGHAFLPPGVYKATLTLTEESFHAYGDGGYWATVMSAPVEFEIADKPTPPGREKWAKLHRIRRVSLDRAETVKMERVPANESGLRCGKIEKGAKVIFVEIFDVDPGERYVLSFKCLVGTGAKLILEIDNGKGFDLGPHYWFSADHEWQRIEIEITDAIAGKESRLAFSVEPRCKVFALQDVRMCRVKNSQK
ncbi:MAG: hypothetical protein KGZ25_13075, partial [Planctomycetes bacterium]|nr:hypothetical protein [Planctomycetota bacterium]